MGERKKSGSVTCFLRASEQLQSSAQPGEGTWHSLKGSLRQKKINASTSAKVTLQQHSFTTNFFGGEAIKKDMIKFIKTSLTPGQLEIMEKTLKANALVAFFFFSLCSLVQLRARGNYFANLPHLLLQ